MPGGRSVRIYLADGSVAGIRHGEIANWSGQAIACPRARVSDLREWKEVIRPGVYFLFGVDEESGREVAYIGEAEIVTERISSHISGKDFWAEVVAFTSKDDNLTKAHVRYLESRLVQLALAAGRYLLKNAATPQAAALPRADRDAMEEFIESIRILLGVLGHRALEPLTTRPAPYPTPGAQVPEGETVEPKAPAPTNAVTAPSELPTFFLRVGQLNASAIRTDEGIVVLAGSSVAPEIQPSLSSGYRSMRDRLTAAGTISTAEGKLRFTKDNLFNSPSQAAAIIVGYAINGRDAWRTKEGRTWAQIEEAAAEQLLDELHGTSHK